METAADGFFRDLEISPGAGPAGVQFRERLLAEIKRTARRVHLEVSARAIALNGVAPLGNLPLKFSFGKRRSLGKIHLHARASRFDIADIDYSCQSCGPQTSDGAAAGIKGKMVAGTFIKPAWRHNPRVFSAEVALLRPGNRRLVPRVILVHGISQRVFCDERFRVLPIVVIRTAQQDADV